MILDLAYYASPTLSDRGDAPIDFMDYKTFQPARDTATGQTLLGTVVITMDSIRGGDWKSAHTALAAELGPNFELSQHFVDDLKAISLSCYLSSVFRYYDSISIAILEVQSELPAPKVLEIIGQLLNGSFPVVSTKALLEAGLTDDKKFLRFTHVKVQSPLVAFGYLVALKTASLCTQLSQDA